MSSSALARMDHQRQAGLARGGDMGAEALRLRVARRLVVVIVEPGLADRHHLRMRRQPHQFVGRHVELFGGIVRMRADRAEDVVELPRRSPALASNRLTRVEIVTMRPTPAAWARATIAAALLGEIRKIEMAMAVDQHQASQRFRPARHSAGTPARRRQRRARHQRVRVADMRRSRARPPAPPAGRAAWPPTPA